MALSAYKQTSRCSVGLQEQNAIGGENCRVVLSQRCWWVPEMSIAGSQSWPYLVSALSAPVPCDLFRFCACPHPLPRSISLVFGCTSFVSPCEHPGQTHA